jgi:transposase-like protein
MDYMDRLFDDIERILKRDGKTIGDLARELGKSYNQVYDWVRMRKFNPRAAVVIQLQGWRDANLRLPAKASARLVKLRGAHTE